MGHHTAIVTISAERAEQLRQKHATTPRATTYWGGSFGAYQRTFEDELVTEAVHEWSSGDDGYGDERSGAAHVTPISPRQLSHQLFETDDDETCVRDGHSVIVPVADDKDVITSTRKLRVPVDAGMLAQLHAAGGSGHGTWGFREHVLAQLGDEAVHVSDVAVVKLPKSLKPKAVATEGRLTTVYQVIGSGRFGVRDHVHAECESLADARAKALELMESDSTVTQLDVRGVQRRITEDGSKSSSLLTITRPAPANATVEAAVTFLHVKKGAKPAAYVVAFDYHS